MLQGQAKVLERQNAIETRQLVGGIVTIAGESVYLYRFKEAEFIIVT